MISHRAIYGHFARGRAVLTPLLRQFWMILLIVAVGTLASLAYGRMQVPSYEASAFVQARPGVDVTAAKTMLTSRRNLLAILQRHGLGAPGAGASLDRAAVLLRQAIAVHDMTSQAGQTLGFAPETTGIVVSVLLPDAETSARIANDLAQQLLDWGNSGSLGQSHEELAFYRREELRLWQETSALQAEMTAIARNGTVEAGDTALLDQRRLTLLQDQYDLVRLRLAEAEVQARRMAAAQAGQFSLLQRATATEAVSMVRNWMLVGVAGSLLLAVTVAFVLDRRYPGLQRGSEAGFARFRTRTARAFLIVDDPARPIMGMPRFVVFSAVLVAGLIGIAALIR